MLISTIPIPAKRYMNTNVSRPAHRQAATLRRNFDLIRSMRSVCQIPR